MFLHCGTVNIVLLVEITVKRGKYQVKKAHNINLSVFKSRLKGMLGGTGILLVNLNGTDGRTWNCFLNSRASNFSWMKAQLEARFAASLCASNVSSYNLRILFCCFWDFSFSRSSSSCSSDTEDIFSRRASAVGAELGATGKVLCRFLLFVNSPWKFRYCIKICQISILLDPDICF